MSYKNNIFIYISCLPKEFTGTTAFAPAYKEDYDNG